MRAVAARWWATAHRARSEERVGRACRCCGLSNRQVKEEKTLGLWPTIASTSLAVLYLPTYIQYVVSSVSRRTPTPSASTWPRSLPRRCWWGGRRRSDRRKQRNFAPRARGASRCMRGAEHLILQKGQAARRDLSRALKAGPGGAERSHRLRAPPSVPGAPDTRCLLRRFPVQV